MPQPTLHRRSFDLQSVARLARGKISRETSRPDPNLRMCVGHANVLEQLNNSILNAFKQRILNCDSYITLRPGPTLCPDTNHQKKCEYQDRELMLDVPYVETVSKKCQEESTVGVSVISLDAYEEDTSDDDEQPDLSLHLARQIPHPAPALTPVFGHFLTGSASIVKVRYSLPSEI